MAPSVAAGDPPTRDVPPRMAAALLGCWQLGPVYRVVFRRDGASGLRALQSSDGRSRDEAVRFDASAHAVGFPAVVHIHAAVVRFAWSGTTLRYVFSTRRASSDPWLDAMPGNASRCR